jgi:hypothetical protein
VGGLIEQAGELMPAAPGSSGLETIPAGEAEVTQAVARLIEVRVRAAARNGPAHRDAHPKAHGCAEAYLDVLPKLPPKFAVGLFAEPRRYAAWLRFSNGAEKPDVDSARDARGIAIKIMGVAGSRSGTQDFLMINGSRFFVRDAADYVELQTKIATPLGFFFPGWNPFKFRLSELFAFEAIAGMQVSNPLNILYGSITPFLYGQTACKFSIRPAGPPSAFVDRSTRDFLHDNLVRSLEKSEAAFDFCVQLRGNPSSMPIEDPTIEWPETESPFVPVARIVIPRQSIDTPARAIFSENLSFTPWHGLDDHRPLGGINRVRRTVYETISSLRHALNGSPREEPS